MQLRKPFSLTCGSTAITRSGSWVWLPPDWLLPSAKTGRRPLALSGLNGALFERGSLQCCLRARRGSVAGALSAGRGSKRLGSRFSELILFLLRSSSRALISACKRAGVGKRGGAGSEVTTGHVCVCVWVYEGCRGVERERK